MYIFLHLPKTAGTTLRSLLGEVYGTQNIFMGYQYKSLSTAADAFHLLSPTEQQQTAVISSHLEFGLHQSLHGNNRYITLFRDPIDRVVSTYYFMKGWKGLTPSPIFQRHPNLSLGEFAEQGFAAEVDNGLVRFVGGGCSNIPVGQLTQAHLEVAKSNLRDHFETFGFCEDFNEAMVLFGRKLGWPAVPLYRRENVTPSRLSVDKIGASDLSIIEKHCRLDIELYRYARALYKTEIAGFGNEFNREVRVYERAVLLGHVRRAVNIRTAAFTNMFTNTRRHSLAKAMSQSTTRFGPH